jgi:hypothetical protein
MMPDGTPPEVSVTSAACAGPDVASAADPGSPRCNDSAGSARAAMIPRPMIADAQRLRYTTAAHPAKNRDGRRSDRRCGQSSFGPIVARITGSSVIVTTTETSGTRTPP